MGARALARWTGWISTGWWYSGPTDAIRRKDEQKTPEMNVSDRVLFSKKGINKKYYQSFEYDAFKFDHALWFWLKNH